MEFGSAGVPVGDAAGGCVLDEVVCGGGGGVEHHFLDGGAAAVWGEFVVGEGVEEFEFFGEAEDGPCLAAGPGGESGVALLGVGAAVCAVGGVEDGFVGGAAAFVVGIASGAVEDGEFGGGVDVLEGSF